MIRGLITSAVGVLLAGGAGAAALALGECVATRSTALALLVRLVSATVAAGLVYLLYSRAVGLTSRPAAWRS